MIPRNRDYHKEHRRRVFVGMNTPSIRCSVRSIRISGAISAFPSLLRVIANS